VKDRITGWDEKIVITIIFLDPLKRIPSPNAEDI
jgi:hypothetical protein